MTRRARETCLAIVAAVVAACSGDDAAIDGSVADAAADAPADVTALDAGPVVSTFDGAFPPPRFGACAVDVASVPVVELPYGDTFTLGGDARDVGRASLACTSAGHVVAADAVFRIDAPGPGIVTVRTDLAGTDPWLDTVVYLRDGCDESSRELGCDDDGGARGGASRLFAPIEEAGPLLVFVDGATEDDRGEVELLVAHTAMPTSSGDGSDLCVDATELRFTGDAASLRIATGSGDTTGASNDSGCDGVPTTHDLPDEFYALSLDAPADVVIEVTPAPGFDAAFYLLPDCAGGEAAACIDEGPIGAVEATEVRSLPAGRYVVGVDSFLSPGRPEWNEGAYELRVVLLPPS